MLLIAGAVHQHGDAEILDHLLDLGRVVDHRGLDRQIALLVDQALIVGLAVLAGELDIAALHRLNGRVDVPAGLARAGEPDVVERVHGGEERHGGGSRKIDLVQRLLQHRNGAVHLRRYRRALRHDEEVAAVVDADERVPALITEKAEYRGVLER